MDITGTPGLGGEKRDGYSCYLGDSERSQASARRGNRAAKKLSDEGPLPAR